MDPTRKTDADFIRHVAGLIGDNLTAAYGKAVRFNLTVINTDTNLAMAVGSLHVIDAAEVIHCLAHPEHNTPPPGKGVH